MALARIITRSHGCSQELALDLLARGYAVEIVSPDEIPNNIADLELRVDTAPGDQLIATVQAHDGERSASLEFLHHLKAPMVDFIRRPPEPREAARLSEKPITLLAEPSIGNVALPAEAPRLAATVVSAPVAPRADAECDPCFGAHLVVPPNSLPSPPLEPPSHFAVDESTILLPQILPKIAPPTSTIAERTIAEPAISRPTRRPQRLGRSAGVFWAALIFAGVVLLALVLAFGLRQTGTASAQSSGAAPVEKIAAASSGVNLLSAPELVQDSGKYPEKDPGKPSALTVLPSTIEPEANSDLASKNPQAAATSGRATTSGRHGDDFVARDTVTYLDQRTAADAAARAKLANSSAHRRPSSYQQGGVIAASTVTQLKTNPPPKAAK
jgi:hypothetical protein